MEADACRLLEGPDGKLEVIPPESGVVSQGVYWTYSTARLSKCCT